MHCKKRLPVAIWKMDEIRIFLLCFSNDRLDYPIKRDLIVASHRPGQRRALHSLPQGRAERNAPDCYIADTGWDGRSCTIST